MISIISSTNRPNSKSDIIATYISDVLSKKEINNQMLSLTALNGMTIHNEMYNKENQASIIVKLQDQFFLDVETFIFIVPEYNGGIPGILKFFIDAISIRKYAETFHNKKVCLIGVSSGRSGCTRGLDYMTNALNYLKMNVFSSKLPISSVHLLTNETEVTDADTKEALNVQIESFLKF